MDGDETMARRGGLTQPLQAEEGQSTAQVCSSPCSTNDIPCVLFLEGWSPGPLFYLQRALKQWQLPHDDPTTRRRNNDTRHHHSTSSCSGIRILQPSLDMPPVTCTWCCNWRFGVMMIASFLYIWGARRTCQKVLQRGGASQPVMVYYQYLVLFTLIGLILMRAVVSEVVRTSVRHNLELCQRLLAKHNKNIVLVVGFSWGGAIGAELVAQGILGTYCSHDSCIENSSNDMGRDDDNVDAIFSKASSTNRQQQDRLRVHEPPAVLLIAPTTSLIASLSILKPYRTDAALRIASWSTALTTTTTSRQSAEAEAAAETTSTTRRDPLHRSSSPTSLALIQVVHAQGDGFFCPHPERWQQQQYQGGGEQQEQRDVDLTVIPDENHVFQRPSTQRTLTDLMFHLLRKKGVI